MLAAKIKLNVKIISRDIMNATTDTVDRQITSERTVLGQLRVALLTYIKKKGMLFIIN